jgi:alkylation response protein AidB-like acyl-CoA dehydrogenase
VEKFAARADAPDRAGNFPSENFAELAVSGALGAFVPESLGGLGLDSVRDWVVGLSRLGRADASTAIALNMHQSVLGLLRERALGRDVFELPGGGLGQPERNHQRR